MVNHYKQRKQWAESKKHALSLTGCAQCGRWGDKVSEDGLACRLVTSEEVHKYETWVDMPDYAVWNHELHLGFGVAECNPGCEKENEKPKSIGLAAAIKAALKVEDIASRLTELHGYGNRLKGKCPLHGEVNGQAFSIWLDTGTWRCFGACATGGDVIDFVRECHERGIKWRAKDLTPEATKH